MEQSAEQRSSRRPACVKTEHLGRICNCGRNALDSNTRCSVDRRQWSPTYFQICCHIKRVRVGKINFNSVLDPIYPKYRSTCNQHKNNEPYFSLYRVLLKYDRHGSASISSNTFYSTVTECSRFLWNVVFPGQTNVLSFLEQSVLEARPPVLAAQSLVQRLSWLEPEEIATLSTAHPLFAFCIQWFRHSVLSGPFIKEIQQKNSAKSWWPSGSKNSPNLKPHKPLSVF